MKKNKFGMIRYTILLLCLCCTKQILPQATSGLEVSAKPVLDTSAFEKWTSAQSPAISNDGEYYLYIIKNEPIGSSTLVVCSRKGKVIKKEIGVSTGAFINDTRQVIFSKQADSLCILSLKDDAVEAIANVKRFELFSQKGSQFVIYQLNNSDIVIRNIKTKGEKIFYGVTNYAISKDGCKLILATKYIDSKEGGQMIVWVDLLKNTSAEVWKGTEVKNLTIDDGGEQLAFVVDNGTQKSLWYFKEGSGKAVELASKGSPGIDNSLEIEYIRSEGFSNDGKRVFFGLRERKTPNVLTNTGKSDIWNYKDSKLMSLQQNELSLRDYAAVIDISTHRTIQLERVDEEIKYLSPDFDDYVVIIHLKGDIREYNWNFNARRAYYYQSTIDGKRTELSIAADGPFVLSPKRKFLIGRGIENKNDIYSLDILSGAVHNLTSVIPKHFDDKFEDSGSDSRSLEVACWLNNGDSVIVYDGYDLWRIDPSGVKAPISLTNGYGRKHYINFKLAENNANGTAVNDRKLLLWAFDRTNKSNNFYQLTLNGSRQLKLLSSGNWIYNIKYKQYPLKARDKNVYLLWRMNASQSPNYCWTSDFVSFNTVSSVYPENNYNWLNTELHTWTALNGRSVQGILYKPENFDSTKKYPVIIHYYEKLSDRLNEYLLPNLITDHINIPLFVSNGYLVFTPDIYYTIGNPGEGACNSVVSAAKYLAKYFWVDSNKIGIQGHSWGGYETNYIVTHVNIFAAAMSSSGPSDFISGYGSIAAKGNSYQNFYEVGQSRMGATLWEKPELYIKNSPVFNADKVSTPLLMMNNKDDGAVPFGQGVELFTALRRLNKMIWMLQYDDGKHTLAGSKIDALQHTIRVFQFFDHFLKNAPAPGWMSRGIPARLKGVETGYAYDPSGNCGEDCKVCKMWIEKYQKDSAATMQEIERRKKEEHW